MLSGRSEERRRLKALSLEFVRSAARLGDLPAPGLPEVALLGRSNVGKSSLLNSVGGSKRLARISRSPGRTQAIHFYRSDQLIIVDLPGYGYAKVPESVRRSWGRLIEGYLEKRESLAGGLLILDSRHEPNELDRIMHDWLVRRSVSFLAVATKADKLKRGEMNPSLDAIRKTLGLRQEEVLLFSAKSGLGRSKLIDWIRQRRRS
jgi:GTP-binding protein